MEEMVIRGVEGILKGTGGKLNNNTIEFSSMTPTKVVNDVATRIDGIGIIIEGIKKINDKVFMFLKTTSAPNSWATMTTQEIIDAVKIGGA